MSKEKSEDKLVFAAPAAVIERFVNELAVMVDEAKIIIAPDGLHAKVVDPAHISMCDTWLSSKELDSWEPPEGHTEFGVDIDVLRTCMKRRRAQKMYSLITVDFAEHRLVIKTERSMRTMRTIDPTGMGDHKVPNLKLAVQLKILDRAEFFDALDEAQGISDHIKVIYSSSDKRLELMAEGDDSKFVAPITHEVIKDDTGGKGAMSLFPMEYMLNIVRALPEEFTLDMDNDFPIKMGFGHGFFLLAPRIESGD